MRILVVDDSHTNRIMLKAMLEEAGYKDLLMAKDAFHAFDLLNAHRSPDRTTPVDLILMDIIMPRLNGIDACKKIKEEEELRDIPVIIVTGRDRPEDMEEAFNAGAHDYLAKPVDKIALLARSRSALRLKSETDRRIKREQELLKVTKLLERANKQLQHLSAVDGLTGIANRRQFDEVLAKEWKRSMREETPLSLVILDIDFFKLYNDNLGHTQGDVCIKRVAQTLESALQRPGDLVCRYGGEEFAVILPNTPLQGALHVAEQLHGKVLDLKLPHPDSQANPYVTMSLGVSTMEPTTLCSTTKLINMADQALYLAKENGRNRIECVTVLEGTHS